MLAGSLYLIISGLRWDFSSQLEDARIRLKVQGVYRFMRNPLYMGSMAAVGGLVFLYRSYYGLISFLFYIMACYSFDPYGRNTTSRCYWVRLIWNIKTVFRLCAL